MDFYERKCSGGGLGNKKGVAIHLKMEAKLISNLSVFNFSLFWAGEKDQQLFGGRTGRQIGGGGQTGRQAKADRQTDRRSGLGLGLVLPIESMGFY